jgi:hypothetical protein
MGQRVRAVMHELNGEDRHHRHSPTRDFRRQRPVAGKVSSVTVVDANLRGAE